MSDLIDDRAALVADDAHAALVGLYGERADEVWERLLATAATYHGRRSADLLDRDRRREADRGWFLSNRHIGYKAYADRFGGTLRGVADRIGHLDSLGVTFLHLMSVLTPRQPESDGGYAIDDYTTPDPKLGTVDDLRWLATQLGSSGINLVLDLVLNHTSDEHDWARQARTGSRYHQNLYIGFPDRTLPDQYEESLPEIFPTMAPGNFTYVADWCPARDDDGDAAPGQPSGQWVWTTFREFQWDLNWANPDVLLEMAAIALHLANLGVSVLRLDAVAFTWKRLGTNCQNQPEAHLIAQVLRSVLEIAAPATLLLAEAIVGPADLVGYLGGHEFERSECHLAYHNQLMVQGWSMLASTEVGLAEIALNDLPTPPPSTTWFTYVRNHDDIGWAIDDEHALRAGRDGPAHRAFLASYYRGDFPGSFAAGTPFSTNDAVGDERTSGMTATLVGLSDAIAARDQREIDRALARHRFLHAIAYGWGGIPLLYMGDEFGQADAEPDEVSEVDSRWLHRPWWDPALAAIAADDPESPAGRAQRTLITLAAARQRCRPLAGGTSSTVVANDTGLFVWRRRHPRFGELVGIANPHDETVAAGQLRPLVPAGATDALGADPEAIWSIAPYDVRWFTTAARPI